MDSAKFIQQILCKKVFTFMRFRKKKDFKIQEINVFTNIYL